MDMDTYGHGHGWTWGWVFKFALPFHIGVFFEQRHLATQTDRMPDHTRDSRSERQGKGKAPLNTYTFLKGTAKPQIGGIV
jgi:hypothetical protein